MNEKVSKAYNSSTRLMHDKKRTELKLQEEKKKQIAANEESQTCLWIRKILLKDLEKAKVNIKTDEILSSQQ